MTSEPGVEGLVEVLTAVHVAHKWAAALGGCWSDSCDWKSNEGDDEQDEHAAHVAAHLAHVVQAYTEQRADERVAEALRPVLAECDYAEQHQSQVMDDEVLVATGLIRHAARIVREQAPATGGGS